MVYLEPAEYAAYGLGAETADAWITAASAMIDAFCRRATLGTASYTERLRTGRSGAGVRLSYGPLLSVDAVRVRFGFVSPDAWPANGVAGALFGGEFASAFCTPGVWTSVDATSVEWSAATGELTLPVNLMGARYSEVEATYTAGFSTVPPAIKVACAQIVRNAQATPGLNVKSSRLDTMATEYFSDSLLDAQVRTMLQPFVAERLSA